MVKRMDQVKLSPLQQSIVGLVRTIRAENHACTMREVARRTMMNASYISDQINQLINAGILGATDLAGSLHVIADLPAETTKPTPPPSQRVTPAPAKKAPAKKAAAKKVAPRR